MFMSDEDWLIGIGGMYISNDRNESDYVELNCSDSSSMLQGNDGYPKKHEDGYFCIGGG